jgi:hypothetical protein
MQAPRRNIVHVKTFEMRKTLAFAKTLPPIILLTSTVPFSSGFEEAKTCAMKLAKTDLQVQELFYDCLYTHNIWDKYAE